MTNTNDRAGSALAPTRTNPVAVTPRQEQKVGTVTYRPRINMYAFGDRYEMHVEMPGTTSEQIEASIEDGVLTIHATVQPRHVGDQPWRQEYGIGDFRRQVRLGEDVDADRLSASYEHGVLTVVLPKLPERQPRRVPIGGG